MFTPNCMLSGVWHRRKVYVFLSADKIRGRLYGETEEFPSTRKIRECLHDAEILVPCDHHVGKGKMKAGDKNENAIQASLPSSLTLITTVQQ